MKKLTVLLIAFFFVVFQAFADFGGIKIIEIKVEIDGELETYYIETWDLLKQDEAGNFTNDSGRIFSQQEYLKFALKNGANKMYKEYSITHISDSTFLINKPFLIAPLTFMFDSLTMEEIEISNIDDFEYNNIPIVVSQKISKGYFEEDFTTFYQSEEDECLFSFVGKKSALMDSHIQNLIEALPTYAEDWKEFERIVSLLEERGLFLIVECSGGC